MSPAPLLYQPSYSSIFFSHSAFSEASASSMEGSPGLATNDTFDSFPEFNDTETLKKFIYAFFHVTNKQTNLLLTSIDNETLDLRPMSSPKKTQEHEQDHSSPESEEDMSICDRLFDILDFLHVYYIPAIVLMGVVCNMLNVAVFMSPYLRRRSSSYYLAALALSDTCFLVSLGLIWIGDTLEIQTFNKNGWCQSVVYMSTASSFLSVWLTVGFTVERFVAVQYPLQKPQICTVSRAKMVILALVLISLLVNCYTLFTAGVVRRSFGLEVCDVKPQYRDIMKGITVADSILTLAIPSVLIGIMNTVIVRSLMRFSHQLRLDGVTKEESSEPSNSIPMTHLQGTSRLSQNNLSKSGHLRLTPAKTSGQLNGEPSDPARSAPQSVLSTKTQRSVTKMLLLISTTFLILNIPSYAIRLYIFLFYSIWEATTPTKLWCIQQFCMLLFYTNFSINFILYSLYGTSFRRCLNQLLRRKLRGFC